MIPSASNTAFLNQRRLANRVWKSTGPLLIGGLVILYGFLWFTAPMLVNPFAVLNRLQAESIDITTLQTMAIMLPVVFCLLCVLVVAVVIIIYRMAALERRYQLIVEAPGAPLES